MSNIYIQEPPASGKVLLKTTVGDIDVELWSRECPKACRNFIQLCMEGYYNGTIFHRVVKGFIVQGGDPNGNGTGGESIYGEPFKDEFHSRLRFIRRGLVGMANSDKDDNGSQFFFTMGPTPELTNKHTLFGKVTGDTVFNMLKLEDGMVDHNERPMYPNKILKVEILSNPFNDIEPREKSTKKKEKKKSKEKGVKNFGLLSFGEEADQDEQETASFVQKLSGKGKSTHDVLDDPTLSKATLELEQNKDLDKCNDLSDIEEYENVDTLDSKETTERIKNKLKMLSTTKKDSDDIKVKTKIERNSDSEDDIFMPLEEERKNKMRKKKEEIMQEIQLLKKNYKEEKKKKEALYVKDLEKDTEKKKVNELFQEYNAEREKYFNLKEKLPKKGTSREDFTLQLLSKFKNKLETVKEKSLETVLPKDLNEEILEKEIENDDWLGHTLKFEDNIPVLAKDASTKTDDWYDVYDPRNPLNKRKRGDDKRESKKSKN